MIKFIFIFKRRQLDNKYHNYNMHLFNLVLFLIEN